MAFPGGRRSPDRIVEVRLFVLALALRLGAIALINITGAMRGLRLSPDSMKYHYVGKIIAARFASGSFDWSRWIDNGWYQFVGLVYWAFGPHALLIQLINAVIGSAIAIVAYRLALRVYQDQRPARMAGLFVAVAPSFVYYSTLLLKDSPAILALSALVLAIVMLRDRFAFRSLVVLVASLAVLLAVRDYLFIVGTLLTGVGLTAFRGQHAARSVVRAAVVVTVVGLIAMALGLGFLGFDYAGSTDYFDLAFINSTRAEMSKGSGAMYEDPVTSPWGSGVASDLKKAALAVYYFVVSLDLRDIRSVRQLMALPEVLAFLVLIPVLFRGAWDSWARVRGRSFPLLLFAAALIVVYGSATTNLGAMFRWRMQAMPLLLVFVAHGLALRPWHPLARLALRVSSRLAGEHPYLPARKEDWRIPGRARSSRSQPVLR